MTPTITFSVGVARALGGPSRGCLEGNAAGRRAFEFEIGPFARTMIKAGTDEIGYGLSRLLAIDAWKAAHPALVDSCEGAVAR